MRVYSNSVTPEGKFIYGIHKPSYTTANLRNNEKIESLGRFDNGDNYLNHANFPENNIEVSSAKWIYEIPNPFPFRGVTFIDKDWADAAANDYAKMLLPKQEQLSFTKFLLENNANVDLLQSLPQPILLTLAVCSTDPEDLIQLARLSCEFIQGEHDTVAGQRYKKDPQGNIFPNILNHDLFEAVANNPHLPDEYKRVMVLRPGAQGNSEIVGDWQSHTHSHVFEYLRRNSYIAGGHFAANMADDSVRYSIADLCEEDMHGLRHLYYQRMFIHVAALLGIDDKARQACTDQQLEELRLKILRQLNQGKCDNLATLWGWNFGFDYSPTNYRLHASHQQIHQQYAMIPEQVQAYTAGSENSVGNMRCFSSGDMIADVINEYYRNHNSDFFTDYFSAIHNNSRMDNRANSPSSLIVWENDHIILLVPKAQTSQWELQIMTKPDGSGNFPGNVFEADFKCRNSLNSALLLAQQIYEKLGAKMVTSIEFSKRIAERERSNQPLIYSLLPKLPFSPGAFSEAQLRFINGHYPEDFAALCRKQLQKLESWQRDS